MPLSTEDRERIEAFRSYIEDYVAPDDRYGPAVRQDREARMWFASRFEMAPRCWFEVGVDAAAPRVRVAFLTSDAERKAMMEEAIAESGGGPSQYLAGAIADAGLDWPEASLEQSTDDGLFCYATHVKIDELRDLDNDNLRDNTLRILEGFVLAFAPALVIEEEAD